MLKLTIEREIDEPGKRRKKTRRFSALSLGFVLANQLWEGGTSGAELRPVFLAVAGKESTLRPFLANLRAGRRASIRGQQRHSYEPGDGRLRLLKKAGYLSYSQRTDSATITTFYLPSVLQQEQGMVDPKVCQFVSLPSQWWIDRQAALLAADKPKAAAVVSHARRIGLMDEGAKSVATGAPPELALDKTNVYYTAALAAHYMSTLDKRTRRPLVDNLAFALQLYVAALAQGIASLPIKDNWENKRDWNKHSFADGFWIDHRKGLGLAESVITVALQGRLDEFLAWQIMLFQKEND